MQTACSTSLVAVHLACQSLLRECDMALAGGVAIDLPQRRLPATRRAASSRPTATAAPSTPRAQRHGLRQRRRRRGAQRLEDALADGDRIHAVIRGSAVNNDGSLKVGYTAPSVDGQAEVIAAALAVAGVDPDTIGLRRGPRHRHAPRRPDRGRGADPGLPRADRRGAGFCALGSVKTNIGHLDAAAGVAGLIKTVLALEHGAIPPSLHFEQPNPRDRLRQQPVLRQRRG